MSRVGQCPTKSSETSSAAAALPVHNSLIHRWYSAFAVVIADVYPAARHPMRRHNDPLAEPNVRNAIAVNAPAINWLTTYTPPNNAAKSTVPATTAIPTAKCHNDFGAQRRDSTQLNTT